MSNRPQSKSPEKGKSGSKVFIGGLKFNVTASDIREKFSPFGHVVDV